jgi:hypothetical protein
MESEEGGAKPGYILNSEDGKVKFRGQIFVLSYSHDMQVSRAHSPLFQGKFQ